MGDNTVAEDNARKGRGLQENVGGLCVGFWSLRWRGMHTRVGVTACFWVVNTAMAGRVDMGGYAS